MITLSSDFGSPYPAAMKGVVCQRTDARLVDIAHDFPRQDVRTAAFWLREVLPYFPPAVHLVVVDPGVGTDRDAIVVRAGGHALVGPDNGVLLPAAQVLAGSTAAGDSGTAQGGALEVFRVREGSREASQTADPGSDWPPSPGSSTFHGRDVFAPVAARVHTLGVDAFPADRGFEPLETWESLRFPSASVEGDSATGEVLVVDGFGNVITNVPGAHVRGRFGSAMQVNGEAVPVREAYATVDPGVGIVTVGSHGNVELAVNRGRGDDHFDLEPGSTVRLAW